MDITELLSGQQAGGDLNTDLAAVTPAGDSVFSKPFGAATSFRTEKGAVRVAVVFDPFAKYDEFAILASIDTDYMSVVREEISKFLLQPEELASRKNTEQEVVWESIKKNLPNEVLTKCVFANEARLNEYLDLVKNRAHAVFREDELLWQKLSNESFSFSIKLAIDAFYNKNLPSNGVDGMGILTIRIDGGNAALASMRHLDTPQVGAAADASPKGARRKPARPADAPTAAASAESQREDMELVAQLTHQLHMTQEDGEVIREKSFPESTDDFFDAVSKWFSVVVAKRARRLDAEQARNPLYQ